MVHFPLPYIAIVSLPEGNPLISGIFMGCVVHTVFATICGLFLRQTVRVGTACGFLRESLREVTRSRPQTRFSSNGRE